MNKGGKTMKTFKREEIEEVFIPVFFTREYVERDLVQKELTDEEWEELKEKSLEQVKTDPDIVESINSCILSAYEIEKEWKKRRSLLKDFLSKANKDSSFILKLAEREMVVKRDVLETILEEGSVEREYKENKKNLYLTINFKNLDVIASLYIKEEGKEEKLLEFGSLEVKSKDGQNLFIEEY